MTVATGTRFGPYEVIAPLGAGGMGEVYRARDTRLGRDVAVKVLPSTFSDDADRLRRFEQEACAAGALNHPNILIVHDIGTHEKSPYVVSELLEGETLRQRMSGAALAQRRVLDYALQIAHGLAAAHQKGIVHRDLKPDNIFITKDGRIKILDFGLAKLTQTDGGQPQTNIPTRRVDTDPGIVMGTVGYMSPEQVRGRPVDHRSDIFSFGAILYEMLSGQRAFYRESTADTISAILKEDPPDLSETNQGISPALERVVNHCLEKNPEERFHSARDLAFALEALSGSTATSNQTFRKVELPSARVNISRWLPWAVAVVAILVAALALAVPYFRRGPEAKAQVVRFPLTMPEKSSTIGPPVISPDGNRVVYRLNFDGKELLWLHSFGSLDPQPISGTDGGIQPFWSPDSRSIGFFSDGKLKRVDLSGGPPQTICDALSNFGGTWGRDGVIVFSAGPGNGLYRVPVAGGTPALLIGVDESRKESELAWPYFLPDGRHFLYLARSMLPENTAIRVGSLDSTETEQLLKVDSSMAFAPPGYILFVRGENALMAQGLDASSLELTGEPFPLAENALRNPGNGRAFFSVSDNGVLALRTGSLARNQLIWFDRAGNSLGDVTLPSNYLAPALSPDEKRVAVGRTELQRSAISEIWLSELQRRGVNTRFTFGQGNDRYPAWSPDGSRIAFVSRRDAEWSIYQKSSTGAGTEEVLLASVDEKFNLDWSPDGRFLLYSTRDPNTNSDLMLLPLSGERKPEPFLKTNFIEEQARFSPDGRWVAYSSNESGQFQIYVQSFPPSGGKWMISTDGGSQPCWRGDGRELFYFAPNRHLMAVEVNGGSSAFEAGVPRPLFELRTGGYPLGGFPGNGFYTASRDGKRFLVASLPEGMAPQQIIIVLNWTADLKR